MKRRIPGAQSNGPAGVSRLFGRYRSGLLCAGLCAALLLPSAFAFGKEPADKESKRSPDLTEEEKEIVRELELLENLTLLQDLETIDFLDILNEMNPEWAEEAESADRAETIEGGVSK